jgi:LmbE family N-acetylglucosaminyl deacetylase
MTLKFIKIISMVNLKLLKKNKILFVAAHPDDEILGCGGTILNLKKDNDINVIFLTNGISARSKNKKENQVRKNEYLNLYKFLKLPKPQILNFPDNQLDKIPLLKIVKKIEKKIEQFKPNIIFTHFEKCLNIDHQLTYQAVITACRPLKSCSVKTIFSFETLSSTEWASFKNRNFQPNYFVDISNNIKNKFKALKFYKSELRKYPHSRSIKAVEALAKIRGVAAGIRFAEAFMLIRHIE